MSLKVGRWVKFDCYVPAVCQLLRLLCIGSQKLMAILLDREFSTNADMGKGLLLPRPRYMAINQNARKSFVV